VVSDYAQALQKAKQENLELLVVTGEIEVDVPGFVRVNQEGPEPRVTIVDPRTEKPVLKWIGALPQKHMNRVIQERPPALVAWARGDASGLKGDPLLVRAGQAADVEAGRRDRCASATASGEIGAFVRAAAIACGGTAEVEEGISPEAQSHVFHALSRAGKTGLGERWAKAVASMPRVPLSMGEHVAVLIERYGEDRFRPILEEHVRIAPTAVRWLRLARAAAVAKDHTAARGAAEKAIAGVKAFDLVRAKAILAQALEAAGERDRAKAVLREAVEGARALPLEAEEATFRARLEVRLAEWR
jgi:hypothetical protein